MIMRTEELNDYLRSHKIRAFSIRDAARIISMPAAYASKFLSMDRYIMRAERGRYYTRDASEYEAASSVIFPSYVSLVSSFRFHNITEQMPRRIYVISTRQHRSIGDLNGYAIEFSKVKKRLMYGYKRVGGAFVADPEKAAVDMLYLNRFVEYAKEAAENGRLSREKFEKYAELSGVGKIMKQVRAMYDAD